MIHSIHRDESIFFTDNFIVTSGTHTWNAYSNRWIHWMKNIYQRNSVRSMNSYFSLIIWSDDRHRPEVFSWDFHCALEMMLEEDWRETMADVRYFRTEENCFRSDWEDRLSMVEIDWQKHLMDNDYQGVNLDVLPPDEMTRWKEHGFCFFFSSRIWYLPVMMFVQVDGVLMTMVLVVVVEWWQVNLLEWCSTEYQERCEKRCHCRCCKQVEN